MEANQKKHMVIATPLSLQAQKAKKVSQAETLLDKASRDAKVQKVIGKKPAGRGRGRGRGRGNCSNPPTNHKPDVVDGNPDPNRVENPQDLDVEAGEVAADAHPKECEDADLAGKWNSVDTCPDFVSTQT